MAKPLCSALSCLLLLLSAPALMSTPLIPGGPQTIYSPLAGSDAFSKLRLHVVNRSPVPLDAHIQLYSLSGSPAAGLDVSLAAHEVRIFDLRSRVLPTASLRGLGGVEISFVGPSMAIGADLISSEIDGHGSVDAALLPEDHSHTGSVEAIWWAPPGTQSHLAFGNSSAQPLAVSISLNAAPPFIQTIPPHGTLIEELQPTSPADRLSAVASLRVTALTTPHSLRVIGYSISNIDKVVDAIYPSYATMNAGTAIYANGLHFSDGDNHLIVRNVTDQSIDVTAVVFPSKQSGRSSSIAGPSAHLDAGQTVELDLASVATPSELDGSAIGLHSTGAAGSIIGTFTHHGSGKVLSRTVPLAGVNSYAASTGSYPWRLDEKTASSTYITNIGNVKAGFTGSIFPQDGPAYSLGARYLEPGETALLDIKQLRDDQVVDPKGIRLSPTVTAGHITWSTIPGVGPSQLFGRGDILESGLGASTHFSASSCNCPNSLNSAYISPGSFGVGIGGFYDGITVTEVTLNSCTGQTNDFFTLPSIWNIDYPSILSVTTGQTSSAAKGLASGSSYYHTSIGGLYYTITGAYGCTPHGETVTATGLSNVLTVSQTPTNISMSSGDTNQGITVSVSPPSSANSEAFSYTASPSTNPNSSSAGTLQLNMPASFTGVDTWPIAISGSNSPSGIWSAYPCVDGVCSSTTTVITVPPQVLIQVLYGEAHGQAVSGDTVTEPAIAGSIKLRLNNTGFGSPPSWQAAITPSQFNGIATSITKGQQPELTVAIAAFTGTNSDTTGGSPCFFSPDSAGFAAIKNAYNTGATTVPSVHFDPNCYGSNRQLVWKTSIGNNVSNPGVPAFIFERQKVGSAAVVQIP